MRLPDVRKWFARSHVPPPALDDEAAMDGGAADVTAASGIARPRPPAVFSRDRCDLLDQLCGEGHLLPGGDAEIVRFAAPLGLSAASSVLLIGAGLGGPPRALALALGAWVTAYEADGAAASSATMRLHKYSKELAKRVTVERYDPHGPVFRANGFHHAIALDPIRDGDPREFLTAVTSALKPAGQVVLIQLIADVPLDPDDPAIAAWCRLERRPPVLPSATEITKALSALSYDVRVVEDISSRHMRLVVQGWKTVLRAMVETKPSAGEAAAMVSEAELWMRRVRLMHAGRLRLMRWHAISRVGTIMIPGRA
jgi:cyclopropane fatty-acyl-phospholipid synthase-like methyltransferase